MRHSLPCSRSKPPPSRSSCYNLPRFRSHVNPVVDRLSTIMQGSNGNSVQDKSNDKGSGLNTVMPPSPKDLSDCVTSWLTYLQMLNGFCSAGLRLSHTLSGIIQDAAPSTRMIMNQCQAMWEELVKASNIASSNLKSQVVSALQELNLSNETEMDGGKSSKIIYNSLVSFVNLQYQLCAACCECLGPVAGCNCYFTGDTNFKHDSDCSFGMIQHCFQRLFPPVTQSCKGAKSPLQFPLSSFQVSQRRWSEAAAQEMAGNTDGESTMRRWSMPWENSKLNDRNVAWTGSRLHPKSKLTVPVGSQERSRSTTPESILHSSMASQEELQEVIQLLSCPMPTIQTSLYQPNAKTQLPGVTLTGCTLDVASQEPWSEATTPGSRRGSSSPHRGSWPIPESVAQEWTETVGHGDAGTAGHELSPATSSAVSRKSSSSTDSSSSHSLHNRCTTGSLPGTSGAADSAGAQEMRTQLYSMWSGGELPLIKLPDTNETIEENQGFF